MTAPSLGRTRIFRIHTQHQYTPTGFRAIPLTLHIAQTLVHDRARHVVTAETLTSEFCTRVFEAVGITVSNTFIVGDGVVSYVGEFNARKGAIGFLVLVAAGVSPTED